MTSVVETYVSWLQDGLSETMHGDVREITTPFLDRHNDHLQFYITHSGSGYRLTDDGYILADLSASGLDINSPKRNEVINLILNGFSVRMENSELVTDANTENLAQKMHFFTQAMLSVNDMFVMAQPRVAGMFFDDVQDYLTLNSVLHVPSVKFTGKSGFDHKIDFVIPSSSDSPEKLVQAINSPSKNTIAAYLFSLTDTVEARGDDTKAIAFLNDRKRIGEDVSDALKEYAVDPIYWSERNASLAMLTNVM